MKLLAYAMDFWSKGQLKALFLEHEVSWVHMDLTVLRGHFSVSNMWAGSLVCIYAKDKEEQYIKWKLSYPTIKTAAAAKSLQSCPTLCDPKTAAH